MNGCNQKNNRYPQMQLDEEQVTDALDSLRKSGAVALIQGDGRVEKYRHLLYDWLGVDKVELAVMAELLLRGAQTLGELRGRAARMEPIKEIAELRPIVESLREKRLLIFLTPPGRGGVVTHNLYQPQELAKVRAEHGAGETNYEGPISEASSAPGSAGGPVSMPPSVAPTSPAPTIATTASRCVERTAPRSRRRQRRHQATRRRVGDAEARVRRVPRADRIANQRTAARD